MRGLLWFSLGFGAACGFCAYGRHPLTLGALARLGLSGYELWIRIEDSWAWSTGIRYLSKVQGTSFVRNMAIILKRPRMQQLSFKMLFLLGAIIFAVICLFRRSIPLAEYLLF